jgi:predicted DNA-binding transcriptional regulator YafY
MTLDVSNDWALRSWLLGFGSRVRVLKPASLASTLREEFTRGAEMYNEGKREEGRGKREDARTP